ncbi:(E)-4-hydroxy-3-methylbut-2-enyl-diphosphate synthase [Fistulifera solaris]|uniref:4-hydroxy-3-methylbut-2-en-1-yl diphosphate synthase (ferredoxin), chloroplastic n=1 Tax=Fistulifera solaris TaxID=1519565 RepID=A0A1Z5KKV3_FISSO|nr:(E)-4-hydroxy-3-methylbut-2-enyl-diphosphate synthase [Fistulifera solaris]|eukprot:GAX26950.1 (E)-4-hydroxy-3-methylbut-2-enyl-diphosphate synthase [Fistulifera solaris]
MVKLSYTLFAFLASNDVASAFMVKPKAFGSSTQLQMSTILTPKDILWTPSHKTGARDEQFGPLGQYCEDLYTVARRKTRSVSCGPISFGSEHPIVRQTMATTNTADVDATIEQVMRCADKGFDLVRVTVQGKREAKACLAIREGLNKKGYDIPLCADMHFQPVVALMVAEAVEKIRINPGNFADGRKDFEEKVYETEEDFFSERGYLVEALQPLVEKCKDLNRCMRIGTNHGSLSSRVLSFYGDTPRGMVESAIEFADICRSLDYHNFVFSMKASNPLVMVQSYRLLAAEMYRLGWDYPLHLGVTEAGEGEDGRMKSAIGIGTLLADGLGDTVRVSLTEDPEFEYEPCNRLAEIAESRLAATNEDSAKRQAAVKKYVDTRDITSFKRRQGDLPAQQEGDAVDVRGFLHRDGSVLSVVGPEMFSKENVQYLYKELGCKTAVGMPFKDIATTDSILLRKVPPSSDTVARTGIRRLIEVSMGVIVPAEELEKDPLPNAVALMDLEDAIACGGKLPAGAIRLAVTIKGDESEESLAKMKELNPVMALLNIKEDLSALHASRRVFEILKKEEINVAVIHQFKTDTSDSNELALQLGTKVGSQLTDGNGDGVMIDHTGSSSPFSVDFLRTTSFSLLQGSRMRNTKTEFVSCPSCGRTLFDLQETTASIQEATGHLPGVTIAVMGCIVNGPGEMADADFGYVGTLPGKVDLYYGKEVVRKNIPNEQAVDALVELIKEYDMWTDKEEVEAEETVAAA